MRALALSFIVLIVITVHGQEHDWRRMKRIDAVPMIKRMTLSEGLNQIHVKTKGFKLYAEVREHQIVGWRAKGSHNTDLHLTNHEYLIEPYSEKLRNDTGNVADRVLVLCVDSKEVCYEVQVIPNGGR